MKELKAIAILKNLMLSPKARFSITSKMAKEALLELEQILQNLKRICEGYKVNISLVKEELKQKALSGVFNASKISK